MRDRSRPRACRACRAPLDPGEDACPRCGVMRSPTPAVTLRLIEGGAAPVVRHEEVAPTSTSERLARLIAQARA